MKALLLPATLALALTGVAGTAEAAGCIKGAVVGGVAGHYAGHHAVLGAAAGCAIGHHEATVARRNAEARAANNNPNPATTRTTSAPP